LSRATKKYDQEREKLFSQERKKRLSARTKIQRDTANEIYRLLSEAEKEISDKLASSPTEWESWYLPQLQQSIRQSMDEFSTAASSTITQGASDIWQAGIDLIDKPLQAAGLDIVANLPGIDNRQLIAMRTFMTDRMKDIGVTVANKINSELGLIAIGAQTPGDAISKISRIIDKGGRSRATTIVRTEVGRAFSVATHERMTQSSEYLPGLKKQWRRSGKVHSRLSHDAADGQIKEVGEPFNIGGVLMMHPRDPAAPAGETINCGCEELPYMDSWEMKYPGKKPFSDLEKQLNPNKLAMSQAKPLPNQFVPDINQAGVKKSLATKAFAKWLTRPRGYRQVGMLDTQATTWLNTKADSLVLSRASMLKQLRNHPDLKTSDYRLIPDLLRASSNVFRQTNGNLVFYSSVEGTLYKLVMKATGSGEEVFLVSFTKSSLRDLAREKRRSDLLKG
jgi:hypothetical protein